MNPLFLLFGLLSAGSIAFTMNGKTSGMRADDGHGAGGWGAGGKPTDDDDDQWAGEDDEPGDGWGNDGSNDDGTGQQPDDGMGGDGSTDDGADNSAGDGAGQPDDGMDDHDHGGGSSGDGTDEQPDDSTGGHDHGGSTDDHVPDIPPPGIGASRAEIQAYLDALAASDESHTHDAGSSKADEHMAAMHLVPRGEATHVAIGDGDWFDPKTWSNGKVPGDDARVLIPDGVTVNYGGVSDARLFTVRVDGKLDFDTDTDSRMVFDTFIVSPTGHLVIGTASDPVDPNVDIDLVVANNGPIDTTWDPMLLSRGLISHGETTIHGAVKDSHEKVDEDPMTGDTSVKFAGVPEGWQVGDTIVIAGTHYEGEHWDSEIDGKRFFPPEDEVRVISKIDDDGRIHFKEPLVHDHDAPRDDLHTSVANYTRNVSVETENAEDAEVYERGHVMLMHSDEIDVRYAEFHELGRTDKSTESHDISDFDDVDYDSNVQGRYSLHIHRAGTENLDDPAMLVGNAVYGSPGWGYVHHDSNAILENNASYDTFGAGFVAETGNETGVWQDNIAIYAHGIKWAIPKNTSDIDGNFDTGRGGDGFWFQGRMVASYDNVAASVNTGFVYFHRDGDNRMIDFDSSNFDYPEAMGYRDSVGADDAPILHFEGNEAFAANEGLHVVKANPKQGHDIWTHLKDFTAWSVVNGAHLQYTSHYILEDFDVIGKEDARFSTADTGILLGKNTSEMVIIGAKVDGFETGIDLFKAFTNPDEFSPDQHSYHVIDADISNVDREYANYDPRLDEVLSNAALKMQKPDLDLERMTFAESADYDQRFVYIEGSKTDSLGTTDFPGGMDVFRLKKDDIVRLLEKDGYWTTSKGEAYLLTNIYFTDRLTGEIFYETHPIYLDDNVKLGERDYKDAIDNGRQDIVSSNGTTKAGDIVLDKPFPAVPEGGFQLAFQSSLADDEDDASHDDHTMMMDGALAGQELMAMAFDDDESLFDDMAESTEEPGASDDQAEEDEIDDVEPEAEAAVHDDHEDMAEEMHPLAAEDDGFSAIEEFHSGPGTEGVVEQEATTLDLENTALKLDLVGLSAGAGDAFSEMNSEEIMKLFEEALSGGLGARDVKILIDHQQDSVSLVLTAGEGKISTETVGANAEGLEDDLWSALTCDQPVLGDGDAPSDEDDEEEFEYLLSA